MENDSRILVYIDPELKELIPQFLNHRQQDVNALVIALEANDADTIRSIGHDLRGVGGAYGFSYIQESGESIEACGKAGRLDEVHEYVYGLSDYLSRIEIIYQD